VGVPTDEHGMRIDALEAALQKLEAEQRLERVKLIYVVSYYDNPRGVGLGAGRQRELVELARRWSKHHRILILEDAAYRELGYDGPRTPSVWGSASSQRTCLR